ncbi:hypothetical protein NBRC116590_16930 [Pelagimonas sp. KU-00592-HH]|uniref:sensor histidine kinase n=1 Tax=Pelagimonas sp. KU-00592-HH TaxID=3127651 RepID=UPI00310C524D
MHETLSQKRIKQLKKLCELSDADAAILWLGDTIEDKRHYLCSYSYGLDESTIEKLYGHSSSAARDDEIELEVKRCLESAGLDGQSFEVLPIVSGRGLNDDFVTSSTSHNLGFLAVRNPTNVDGSQFLLSMDLFASILAAGRNKRIIDAIKNTQELLEGKEGDIDLSLMKIGDMVRRLIGAERFVFSNRNSMSSWVDISIEQDEIYQEEVEVRFTRETDPMRLGKVERRQITITENDQDRSTEMIIAPLLQPSFPLSCKKLSQSQEFLGNLNADRKEQGALESNEVSLLFIGKNVDGYLQDEFSQTDLAVASGVFGYLSHYAAACIFDENYTIVSKYLREHSGTDATDPSRLFKVLRKLTKSLVAVHSYKAHFEDERLSLSETGSECVEPIEKVPSEYLDRLSSTIRAKASGETILDAEFGLEESGGRYWFEFYLPTPAGADRLILAEIRRNRVSESILRALVLLFSELYVRLQKVEHENDRATFLVQVRHSVIHHFAAADNNLKTLEPLWERGSKNKEYWEALRDDPLIGRKVRRAIWSLGQANLILENGKYLLDHFETEPVNRKNYKISEIITDCLRTVEDQRLAKSLTVIHKTVGAPQGVMNSEEIPLKIAMLNLFDNAVKYTQVGKTLRWFLEYRHDRYRFEITSFGPKLDPKRKDKLFSIGYRGVQKDHLNQRQGTGLGLPVAYRILKWLSPEAVLDFEPHDFHPDIDGEGNTFFFEMPYLTGTSRED